MALRLKRFRRQHFKGQKQLQLLEPSSLSTAVLRTELRVATRVARPLGSQPSPLAFLTRLMQNGGVDEVARWLVESVELPQYEQAYWQLQLEPAAGARPTYNRGPPATYNDARA